MSYHCEVCDETYMTDEEHRQHCSSNHHAKNMKLYGGKEKKIFVTGFLPDLETDQLSKYFLQYGHVKNVFRKNKAPFAFVEFTSESDAAYALKFVHIFEGRKLVVKQCTYARKSNMGATISHQDIISDLQKCSTVKEQITAFVQKLSLSQADIDSRITVVQDVWKAIQIYYPEGSIHVYGSTVNGFGMKGCDLDLLFEPSPTYWDLVQPVTKKRKRNKTNAGFSINDVEEGLVSYEERINQPHDVHLQFIHEVLVSLYAFQRPCYIPARCPIVRFTHRPTRQQCDFSCSTKLVVFNTKLLEFYSKLDARIQPIMLILRYWAKFRGIVGVRSMSSYAFSLLVLFFLQNTKPAVVPSVTYIKSLADEQVIVAGWDCSFCTDKDKIKPSANSQTVEELILAFFQYYADFDFAFVVSPLSGEPLSRSYFSTLSNEDDQNFESSIMCVQDPLECSRNVTAFLNASVLVKLKKTFREAALSCQTKINAVKPSPSWGIQSLFQSFMPIEPPLRMIHSDTVFSLSKNSRGFTFMFSREWKDCVTSQQTSGLWLDKIYSALLDIFTYSLKFDAEVIDIRDAVLAPKKIVKRSADNESLTSANKIHCSESRVLCSELKIDTTANCDKSHTSSEKPTSFKEPHEKQCDNEVEPGELTDDVLDEVPSVSTAQIPDTANSVKDEKESFLSTMEIPDYVTHQMLVSIQNIVSHDVWTDRKKFQGKASHKEQAAGKSLKLEHDVSECIMKERGALPKEILLTCDCYTYRENGHDSLHFVLTPFSSCEDFKPLASFLKQFILYLLNDILW